MISLQTRTNTFKAGIQRLLSSRVAEVLAYPHGVDRYLEVINPVWSTTEVRAEVTAVRYQTADSVTLTLRPNGNWDGFRAGQFVQLTVEIDGVRQTRCYSPANSVHTRDGQIELTAKTHANGFVSRYLRDAIEPGRVVLLSQAAGEFALPQVRPERVLLISGGSGITPVMSMLRTLCDEAHQGRITFLHYCNSAADMIYADELAEIVDQHDNVELVRVFSQPDQGGELEGLFCREHLEQAVPDYAQTQAFLCGPPPMMKAVEALWEEDGLSDQLFKEHFTAAPAVTVDTDNAEGLVTFAQSGQEANNDGNNLLEQAEAAGLTPEHGCRMGICYACTCRKTAGKVLDTRTGKVSEGEEDIQICVSVPVGSVALDI